MKDYEYIESVLANIFNVSVGYTEEEAIDELKKDLASNDIFNDGIKSELKQSLSDSSISWLHLCSQYNVCQADNEADAKLYIKKILWDVVFANETEL